MDLKIVRQELAALMYFEKPKQRDDKAVKFEDLTEAEQKPYLDRAKKVLIYLDQMNIHLITTAESKETQAAKSIQFEALRGLIRDFVGKLNHPRDVAKYFPVDELAAQIVKAAA